MNAPESKNGARGSTPERRSKAGTPPGANIIAHLTSPPCHRALVFAAGGAR
jgi:hypothetical protein